MKRSFQILCVSLAVTPSLAMAQDLTERVREMRQQSERKMEELVQQSLRSADTLSPATAIRNLKKIQLELDIAPEIGVEKRKELTKLVQAKIAELEANGNKTKAAPGDRKTENKKKLDQYQTESKEIADAITDIKKLSSANREREALSRCEEIARKYPNNPVVHELRRQGTLRDRVEEAHQFSREQDRRLAYAMTEVDKSSLPAIGDVEYPKDWLKKMEERRKREGIQLSTEEEAILKALEQTVKAPLDNLPFEESLQTLSNLIDKPIYIDKKSLEEAGKDLTTPVKVPANVSARTALRSMLQAQGLTFIIKEKTIQVVTKERARESLVTRAYYFGDLISVIGPLQGGAVAWGPIADVHQTTENADKIIEGIKQSVDPLSWKERGGTSSISFHYPSMSIIVSAPSEVHASLGARISGRK